MTRKKTNGVFSPHFPPTAPMPPNREWIAESFLKKHTKEESISPNYEGLKLQKLLDEGWNEVYIEFHADNDGGVTSDCRLIKWKTPTKEDEEAIEKEYRRRLASYKRELKQYQIKLEEWKQEKVKYDKSQAKLQEKREREMYEKLKGKFEPSAGEM